MQNDLIGELLAQDHLRLAVKLAGQQPMDDIVLAQLEDRSRFRGLVLAAAALVGGIIAFAEIMALVPAAQLWSGMAQLGVVMALLAIAATISALSRAIAD